MVASGFAEPESEGDGAALAGAVTGGAALTEGEAEGSAEGVTDADGVADGSRADGVAVTSGDALTDTAASASNEVLFLE